MAYNKTGRNSTKTGLRRTRHGNNILLTTCNQLNEARVFALAYSQKHPRQYLTIAECFGWMVVSHTRLNVHSPSDGTSWSGRTGTYWRNGIEKSFTNAQKVADEQATPVLS